MKIFQKLCKKEEKIELTEEEWGEAMASLYENELSDNEEQWRVEHDDEGNQITRLIK